MQDKLGGLLVIALWIVACSPDLPPGLGDRVRNAEFAVVDGTGSDWQPGDVMQLSDLEGKPVILDFWASWCVPCQRQHKYLAGLKESYGEDLTVMGVLYKDEPENVGPWLETHGAAYPIVLDVKGDLAGEYWVNGLPTFVLLSPDRRLSWSYLGPSSENPYTSDSVTVRLQAFLGS
ncbi:MAG: redoxin domain-containing protein [Gemmatimonadota bacterium]|jgi:thiol-disulfide isomerase/thioredoxin